MSLYKEGRRRKANNVDDRMQGGLHYESHTFRVIGFFGARNWFVYLFVFFTIQIGSCLAKVQYILFSLKI